MNKFAKDSIVSFSPLIMYLIIRSHAIDIALITSMVITIILTLYWGLKGQMTNLKKLGLSSALYAIVFKYGITYTNYYADITDALCAIVVVFFMILVCKKSNVFIWILKEYHSIDKILKHEKKFKLLNFLWILHFLLRFLNFRVISLRGIFWTLTESGFLTLLWVFSILAILPLCLKTSELDKTIE